MKSSKISIQIIGLCLRIRTICNFTHNRSWLREKKRRDRKWWIVVMIISNNNSSSSSRVLSRRRITCQEILIPHSYTLQVLTPSKWQKMTMWFRTHTRIHRLHPRTMTMSQVRAMRKCNKSQWTRRTCKSTKKAILRSCWRVASERMKRVLREISWELQAGWQCRKLLRNRKRGWEGTVHSGSWNRGSCSGSLSNRTTTWDKSSSQCNW